MNEIEQHYNIEESFPLLMSNCVKLMRESLNMRLQRNGFMVSSEQWILLVYLAKQDGITQQVLADHCGISKVSVLNLIKKLEKTQLIVRHPDPVDGRSNRVYLTAEGRDIQRSLIPLVRENTQQLVQGVNLDDIEHLKRTVRQITANLNS
jgi:DNA-binding MarR family transcriptional regulator